VAAVVFALVVAMLIITLCEGLSSHLYPLPADLDPKNREAMDAYVAGLPVAALLLVLSGYGLAALVGGWLATRLSKAPTLQPAMIVAAVLLGGSVMNLRGIHHPAWFGAANLLVVFLLPLVGERIARRGVSAV
jgi:hypothetical protein